MSGVQLANRWLHVRPEMGMRAEHGRPAGPIAARAGGPSRALTSRTHLRGVIDFAHLLQHSALRASSGSRASGARVLTVRCYEKTWQAKFDKSPYEILNLSNQAADVDIKAQYRLLVKQCHPDVSKDLDKEAAEERFIRIQAAYELLSDPEQRKEYDKENREHPLAANEAFQAYIAKRKKAFNQRGDLAAFAWAEQQRFEQSKKKQHWMQKGDDVARAQAVREQLTSQKKYEEVTKSHLLVLKKRELSGAKARAQAQKELAMQLLQGEGFELAEEEEDPVPVKRPQVNMLKGDVVDPIISKNRDS
mmetsp:Transcript_806/g.1431  ORF Transcript_806/g.1431 Transcript_806/m.1431 type:complete len:305 (+) Transcript_806:115-1029(+)